MRENTIKLKIEDKNNILRREYKIKDRDFKLYCEKYNKSPYNLLDLIKFKEVLQNE